MRVLRSPGCGIAANGSTPSLRGRGLFGESELSAGQQELVKLELVPVRRFERGRKGVVSGAGEGGQSSAPRCGPWML